MLLSLMMMMMSLRQIILSLCQRSPSQSKRGQVKKAQAQLELHVESKLLDWCIVIIIFNNNSLHYISLSLFYLFRNGWLQKELRDIKADWFKSLYQLK